MANAPSRQIDASSAAWQVERDAGHAAMARGDIAAVKRHFDAALAAAESFPEDDSRLLTALSDSLKLLRAHTDVAWTPDAVANAREAEPRCRRLLVLEERALGPGHPDLAWTLEKLALVCAVQGRYDEAEAHLRRGLELRERALGPDDHHVAYSLERLAQHCRAHGRLEEAERYARRALRLLERALGPHDRRTVYAALDLARLLMQRERFGEAETLLLRIREAARRRSVRDLQWSIRRDLLDLYLAQGKREEAAPLYRQKLVSWRRSLARMDPEWRVASARAFARFASDYASLLRHLGRERSARRYERDAAAMLAALAPAPDAEAPAAQRQPP